MSEVTHLSIEERLDICKSTRQIAANGLLSALSGLLDEKDVSEQDLHVAWFSELAQNDSIFKMGWYDPPFGGMAVLFGSDSDHERLDYMTLRQRSLAAQENVILDRGSGLIYVHASPVDRETGIIGDFGMTIYLGENPLIRDYLSNCYELTKEVGEFVQVGMTLADIYNFAEKRRAEFSRNNDCVNYIDSDIGYTVPEPCCDWSNEDQKVFRTGLMRKIKKVIDSKRKFVSSTDDSKIVEGMSIAIEPRLAILDNSHIPMASYHDICAVYPGHVEMLGGFDPIFEACGMNWIKE